MSKVIIYNQIDPQYFGKIKVFRFLAWEIEKIIDSVQDEDISSGLFTPMDKWTYGVGPDVLYQVKKNKKSITIRFLPLLKRFLADERKIVVRNESSLTDAQAFVLLTIWDMDSAVSDDGENRLSIVIRTEWIDCRVIRRGKSMFITMKNRR